MRIILYSIIISFFSSCSNEKFRIFSKNIDQSRDYKNYMLYTPFFHGYRMSIKKSGELDFINWGKDTFYIHEVFYTEASPLMVGTIWNKKGIVNYTFIGKQRQIPGVNFVDSALISYLNQSKADIVNYYKKMPQNLVKNKFYFEKIVVKNGSFSIIERSEFEY